MDNDERSVETYAKNLESPVELADARAVDGRALLEMADLADGELDLLAGGPPCQGFSLQRRGARNDERNELVRHFLGWIVDLKPRAFLMENVPAIRSVRGKDLLEEVRRTMGALGYDVSIRTLNAADYGVPQNRRRAFVVGVQSAAGFWRWPEISHPEPLTVGAALEGLLSPPPDGSEHPQFANHYRESRLSELNLKRIRTVPEGGNRLDMPEELWLECHKHGHRHLDTYGRLSRAEPAVTLTARFDSFTRGRFGHPVEDRSITLREGARLQGFPDWFVFTGNREDGARMIGNAVPPPLARALGVSLRQALSG
jgi:DNA (cytosine-5)-methyltransferase 1